MLGVFLCYFNILLKFKRSYNVVNTITQEIIAVEDYENYMRKALYFQENVNICRE